MGDVVLRGRRWQGRHRRAYRESFTASRAGPCRQSSVRTSKKNPSNISREVTEAPRTARWFIYRARQGLGVNHVVAVIHAHDGA
jgi:hypothetical protein